MGERRSIGLAFNTYFAVPVIIPEEVNSIRSGGWNAVTFIEKRMV